MNITRFPEKAWAGIEILILSESPELGEKLSERITQIAPEQELRLHVFNRYIEAHDRAKRTKNLGIVLVIESETGNLPLHDVIRELLVPYESRGIPGVAMLFSENKLTVRGALSAKRVKSCLDYLPLSKTDTPESLQKVLFNLYHFKQTRFEEKIFPPSTQDLLQNLRGTTDEDHQFESRVTELLTGKLNLSWMDAIKARWGSTLYTLHRNYPDLLKGMIYEKVFPLEKIDEFVKKSSAVSVVDPMDMPHFLSALLSRLVDSIHTNTFEAELDDWIPDSDTSAFDEPLHRVLLREKESIKRIYEEYFGALSSTATQNLPMAKAKSWKRSG